MGLLKKAVNEQAFLKAGIFGDAGSGKTTTASYLAMAVSSALGKNKPVAFFETEAGSDFLIKKFEAEGIELLRVKSHSLAELIEVAKEAEQTCSCLVVDSISHVWEDLCRAKLDAVNKGRTKRNLYKLEKLEFQHWADVKKTWAAWTALYLNSRLHIIVCGRAGGVWQFDTNDETGKKELQKVGTKMKAEGEFGYEPSLLIEMERVAKSGDVGSGWKHCAWVLKDRTDTINGLKFEFEKPRAAYKVGDWKSTFKAFKPAIDCLNLGGEQITITESQTAEKLFPGADGESGGQMRAKQVDIALEEIEETIKLIWPGSDAASKQCKIILIESLFETRSWTAVQSKSLEDLQKAVKVLRVFESIMKDPATQIESPEAIKDIAKVAKAQAEQIK